MSIQKIGQHQRENSAGRTAKDNQDDARRLLVDNHDSFQVAQQAPVMVDKSEMLDKEETPEVRNLGNRVRQRLDRVREREKRLNEESAKESSWSMESRRAPVLDISKDHDKTVTEIKKRREFLAREGAKPRDQLLQIRRDAQNDNTRAASHELQRSLGKVFERGQELDRRIDRPVAHGIHPDNSDEINNLEEDRHKPDIQNELVIGRENYTWTLKNLAPSHFRKCLEAAAKDKPNRITLFFRLVLLIILDLAMAIFSLCLGMLDESERHLPLNAWRTAWRCSCRRIFRRDYVSEEAARDISNQLVRLGISNFVVHAGQNTRNSSILNPWVLSSTVTDSDLDKNTQQEEAREASSGTTRDYVGGGGSNGDAGARVQCDRWMLLCFELDSNVYKAAHMPVSRVENDEKLFREAKTYYQAHRNILSRLFRRVKNIHFVQFKLMLHEIAAGMKPNQWPSKEFATQWEWEQRDVSSSAADAFPCVDPSYLGHIFNHPEEASLSAMANHLSLRLSAKAAQALRWCMKTLSHASVSIEGRREQHRDSEMGAEAAVHVERVNPVCQALIYRTTPKKIGGRLHCDAASPPDAWGLKFEETIGTPKAIRLLAWFLGFVIIFGVLAFCIVWAIKTGFEVFGLGSAVISLAAFLVAALVTMAGS